MKTIMYFVSLLMIFFVSMLFMTCGIKVLVFLTGYFAGRESSLGVGDFLWAIKISLFLAIVFSVLYLIIKHVRIRFNWR